MTLLSEFGNQRHFSVISAVQNFCPSVEAKDVRLKMTESEAWEYFAAPVFASLKQHRAIFG